MSALSLSHNQQPDASSVALARDAYFSGDCVPAENTVSAECAPPVQTVTTPPEREVTRQEILYQTLRMEMLLSQWRLEAGAAEGDIATPVEVDACRAAVPPSPAPTTGEDYLSQVAVELFGKQAA